MEAGGPGQNATDKRFFWLALYAQPALWVALAVVSVASLQNPIWLSLVGTLKIHFHIFLGTSDSESKPGSEKDWSIIFFLTTFQKFLLGLVCIKRLGNSLTWMVCSNCVDLNNHEHAGVF